MAISNDTKSLHNVGYLGCRSQFIPVVVIIDRTIIDHDGDKGIVVLAIVIK